MDPSRCRRQRRSHPAPRSRCLAHTRERGFDVDWTTPALAQAVQVVGTLDSNEMPTPVRHIMDQLLVEFTTIGFLSDDNPGRRKQPVVDHRRTGFRPPRPRRPDGGRASAVPAERAADPGHRQKAHRRDRGTSADARRPQPCSARGLRQRIRGGCAGTRSSTGRVVGGGRRDACVGVSTEGRKAMAHNYVVDDLAGFVVGARAGRPERAAAGVAQAQRARQRCLRRRFARR